MNSFLKITLENLNLTSIKRGSKVNDYAIYTTTKHNTHIQFTKNQIIFEADNISRLEETLKNTKIEIINRHENSSEKNSLLDYLLLFRTLTSIDNTINIADNIKIEFNKYNSMYNTVSSNNPIVLLPNYKLKLQEKVRFAIFYIPESIYEFYVQELYNNDKPWGTIDEQ